LPPAAGDCTPCMESFPLSFVEGHFSAFESAEIQSIRAPPLF
jgi:hypothetical protein